MAFDLSKAAFGKTVMSNLDTVRKIPLNEISVNRENFYSIDNIDELAESIKMVGLLSPVNVVKIDSGYRLISGHRRFEAYRQLREDDNFKLSAENESKWDKIPAIVVSGLDDLTETMALITANSTARELTYAEKCKQEDILRRTLLAMRDAGKDIPKNLGQYIADQIGVSRNEVSRMHSVNTNLTPEHRAKLEAGELTAKEAYDLSRKPKEAQKAVSSAIDRSANFLDPAQEEVLNDFFDKNEHLLAAAALKYSGAHKSDYANGIKTFLSGFGESCFSFGYFGGSKEVQFMVYNSTPDFNLSYRDLYNRFCRYAIDRLREIDCKGAVEGWKDGVASENGLYVCKMKFNPDASETVRVLYRKNGEWRLTSSATSVVDSSVNIVGWIRLPD